jgi:hypothetical protein
MRIRKPNRVTTPRRAVLNGARASHASIPRARGRWRRGFARNRASAPGRGETAGRPDQDRPGEPVLLPGAGTREVRLGCAADRLRVFETAVADAQRRYDGITFLSDEAGQRIAAVVPADVADFAIRHGALR